MIKDTSSQDTPVAQHTGKRRILVWLIISMSAALLLAYVWLNEHGATNSVAKERIQIAEVASGSFTRDIAATGIIVAANAPQIYSPESGYVSLK